MNYTYLVLPTDIPVSQGLGQCDEQQPIEKANTINAFKGEAG
jgi:hypothetical protein